jgi:hypothetical protein
MAYALVGGNTYGHPVVNLDIEHSGARRVPVPLVVWPNPSAGMINIQASGGEVVRVYDMLGFAEDGPVRCSAQITGDDVAIGRPTGAQHELDPGVLTIVLAHMRL